MREMKVWVSSGLDIDQHHQKQTSEATETLPRVTTCAGLKTSRPA
jgi:hypothetical protein